MKNATLAIRQMLVARLNGAISYSGKVVSVYSDAPASAKAPYILLSTLTAAEAPGGKKECDFQEATALIDIVTRFPSDKVNRLVAESISSDILDNLFDSEQVLTATNFNVQSIRLEGSNDLEEVTGTDKIIRKLIRIRISLYQNTY